MKRRAAAHIESGSWHQLPVKRRVVLERPRVRARVIAMLVEGRGNREIAAAVGVTHQALTGFRRRHRDEIEALAARVREAVADVTIADKALRIRKLTEHFGRIEGLIAEGRLIARDVKIVGVGDYQERIEIERFEAALEKAYRATLHDVAQELGELPKPEVNIDNRQQSVHFTLELTRPDGASDGG